VISVCASLSQDAELHNLDDEEEDFFEETPMEAEILFD